MKIMNRVVLMHAHRALVDPHAPQRHGALGFAEDQRRLDNQTFGNAANLLGDARRIIFDNIDERAKSIGVLRDKLAIDQILIEQHVQHAVEQSDVASRANRQMQVGEVGGFGAPRIDANNHHIIRRAQLALLDAFEDHRMAVRGVGADEEETIGFVEIGV